MMIWFSGEIHEAIEKAIKELKLFIVFVKDDKDDSQALSKIWDDDQISCLCTDDYSVNIMITKGSITWKQFSSIYPICGVPSTYLIDNEGLPIDIIPGVLPVNEFKLRLMNALKTQEAKRLERVNLVPSGNSQMEMNYESEESTTSLTADTEDQKILSTTQDNLLTDEKTAKEKAEALLERIRIVKQQKEKEKIKEQEKKRMREGQDLNLAKRDLVERQNMQLAAEISRRKVEEKAARERVREQLRQDKIDKAAKFEFEKKSRNEALAEKKMTVTTPVIKSESNTARIQFRLPDGSTLSNQFPADAMFLSLQDFICKHMKSPNIRLSTLLPKYEFTTTDMEKSLRELSLVPNASIIVLPDEPKAVSTSQSLPNAILLFIFYPIISLFYWVLSLFSTTNLQQPVSTSHNIQLDSAPTTNDNSTLRQRNNQSNVRQRKNQPNIRQLQRDNEDDDNDNNTWNGNSTQQM